jgi:adenylate kinase family enzyme
MTAHFPSVIFMYGPAGSGKGTQTALLAEKYGYAILDIGVEIRSFVHEFIAQVGHLNHPLAARMEQRINAGLPILTDDAVSFLGQKIEQKMKNGEKVIIDGALRSPEQAQWQSALITKYHEPACLFHIHISFKETTKRAQKRWYVPGATQVFHSQADALAAAEPGATPYQREDDKEVAIVLKRYQTMYEDVWPKVLSIFQLETRLPVFVVNGEQSVEEVQQDIERYLSIHFG